MNPEQLHNSEEENLDPKEKLNETLRLFSPLEESLIDSYGVIKSTEKYTLIDEPIGDSRVENTSMASSQLVFSLALGHHPFMQELKDIKFKELATEEQKEILNKLSEEKVLKGLKILDLGCGTVPTFARLARAFGAEVYTIDIIDTDGFVKNEKADTEILEVENKNHIALDLHNEDALDTIQHVTDGNFDLVTEAHLATGTFRGNKSHSFNGKNIATKLLKEGGLYFRADFPIPGIKIGEELED